MRFCSALTPTPTPAPRPAMNWPGRRPRQQALALGAALRCQPRRLFLSPWPRAPPPRAPASSGLARQGPPERSGSPHAPGKPRKALETQYKNRVTPAPWCPERFS
jgi:hypothetical protein